MAVLVEQRPGSMMAAELADLDDGLARIPEAFFSVLELRSLKRLSNREAASELGVHQNTASRRFMDAVTWLTDYLNGRLAAPEIRSVNWRQWVSGNAAEVLERLEESRAGRSGRRPSFPPEVDARIVVMHCAGATERSICAALNSEFPRADGSTWTRSSVRSVLRRYNAPRRPRGRRPAKGGYRPGDITQTNYGEIEFGEPLCDPWILLQQRPPAY
jgi:hypothetical protein